MSNHASGFLLGGRLVYLREVRVFLNVLLTWFLLAGGNVTYAGFGFDAGLSLSDYVAQLTQAGVSGRQGTWLRVRGLSYDPSGDDERVLSDREALQNLRSHGVKTVVHLRWAATDWACDVRPGRGHRLPLDLRAAFERGRALGAAFGDVVDVWEVENEPDIDFVAENPETFMAFQKAVYLGLHTGAAERLGAESGKRRAESSESRAESGWRDRKMGMVVPLSPDASRAAPLVIMAPPALPPGPYFERLLSNGLLSYTDGFNFHYYGYAEDFTGVYRQFEDAVARAPQARGLGAVNKRLPVFLTEYGYGLLDADSRHSVEGRVRQWRWFAKVAEQMRATRPEGAMAFVWNPYYEAGVNEFGLTMTTPARLGRKTANGEENGGLVFKPEDFGRPKERLWMRRIGQHVGEWHASPALAYMWDYAERNRYRSRDWRATVEGASAVVVDFEADSDLVQAKSSGGYVLTGCWAGPVGAHQAADGAEVPPERSGAGRLILYNFSGREAGGVVRIATDNAAASWREEHVVLTAGERRELPVVWRVPAVMAAAGRAAVEWVPDAANTARAVWITRLLPATDGMRRVRVADFGFSEEANAAARRTLAERPIMEGEPRLEPHGRWLVTDGVRVEEIGGCWRFYIDHLPAEPLRPAMAELPLPERFLSGLRSASLGFDRRRVQADVDLLAAAQVAPSRLRSRAGVVGDAMDVYWRTENGNLFQSWPRLRLTDQWLSYSDRVENFTMGFFGRANLPWRFSENSAAALVFFFRPARIPAIVEIIDAQVFEYVR